MENTKTDYTEKLFIKIFEYGNENSGSLMYDRFLHDFDKDVKEFKNSLCTIDLNKWNKYFYSEPLKELKKKINDNRNFVSATQELNISKSSIHYEMNVFNSKQLAFISEVLNSLKIHFYFSVYSNDPESVAVNFFLDIQDVKQAAENIGFVESDESKFL